MLEQNKIEKLISMSTQELRDSSGTFVAYVQEIGSDDCVSQSVVIQHFCSAIGGESLYYQTGFGSHLGEPGQVVGCSYCNEQRGLHKSAGVVSIAML